MISTRLIELSRGHCQFLQEVSLSNWLYHFSCKLDTNNYNYHKIVLSIENIQLFVCHASALSLHFFFSCVCVLTFHHLVVEDFLLHWGNPEVLEEGLWCDNFRWCRPFCVQLCILSFSPFCRTEGSQIFICPCASIFKNRWGNPDAFCSLPFGSYCIYMLLIWVLIWTFLVCLPSSGACESFVSIPI